MNRLFQAVKNITWKTSKLHYTGMDVLTFIEMNAEILLSHYFRNGFACIIVEKSGNLRLPQVNELKFDARHRVINKNAIVVYSDPYTIEYTTHYMLCQPYLLDFDDNLNNSNFIGNQQGLFGILSGKGMPVSPAAKEEMQDKLKKNYGYNDSQYQFIISNNEVSWTPIEIPVDKLELIEKAKNDFIWICNLFGISSDYILGGSTYNNREIATRDFYRNAVEPLAEVLLRLARATFVYVNTDLEPSTILTYDFSNVPEYQTTLSAASEEKKSYLEYLMALREAGIDVERDLQKLYESSRNMLTDV